MQKIRRLPLHYAYNARDLGGYAIDDTHMTRWHMLYRCDNLHQLDNHDWAYLQKLNIRWIIDLRAESEVASTAYDSDIHGIHRVSIPFILESNIADPRSIGHDVSSDAFFTSMKLDYVTMLADIPQQVVRALHVIATALKAHEGVLFHCSAGKDRTGILSAILLMLCNVSRYDILADYQVSCTYNTLGINNMIPEAYREHPNVKALFSSTPDMMQPLLDMLEEKGIDQYLLEIGCDQKDIDMIRMNWIKVS